jgi:hypothetical protein
MTARLSNNTGVAIASLIEQAWLGECSRDRRCDELDVRGKEAPQMRFVQPRRATRTARPRSGSDKKTSPRMNKLEGSTYGITRACFDVGPGQSQRLDR